MNKVTLPLLMALVLLGNGLRSVISSTVFVSEGTFASFLKISVSQTSAIIELLLGAVLLSLLISPWMLARFSIKMLTTVMCLIASGAGFGLAAMFWTSPPVAAREALVMLLFPLIGFSLASMAPVAQLLTGWGGERHAKLLTGVWAVAMPAAFLVTPQLVRVIAPRYGLDVFFAGFAVAPLLLIAAIWIVREPVKAAFTDQTAPSIMALVPAILTLIAFEVMTLLVTMLGISSPLTQGMAVLFVIALINLIHSQKAKGSARTAGSATMGIFVFLFLVNIATTGFYDTAYLVLHMCSNTLIADRATLAALAQVCAAMGATALLARYQLQRALMVLGAAIAAIGLASYMLYFSYPIYEVYVGSKAITGFGTGLLTTAAIFAVSKSSSQGAGLSLFIAFVIIIGTEVGLELFEVFVQLAELAKIPLYTSYTMIFVAQVVFVLIAIPFVLSKVKNVST
ncbi:hypothetical protein SAMN04488030_0367 [Aliiroseovarius halocynthiae]|uniref:MFS transporter n=1 Tax=Aliiroseovarius halocynthiae TaxID=985055 RepID=A0A545STS6_9RHOB|nr:hypothetical protein [Aliiroseovarius halocynthiae]TQV68367.1 hypothetical protein FIL88_01885 [Aliiroseovarius halocynthiae]SMR70755.1 hypothetical protein SAMN04488030_0367 [Aliiroseovarius halocynthiae]